MLGNVLLLLAPLFLLLLPQDLFYEGANVVMPSRGGKVNFRKEPWMNGVQNVVG